MPGWLEQTSGFLLLALVLLNVFLDVLYARLGRGILARRISPSAFMNVRRSCTAVYARTRWHHRATETPRFERYWRGV